jgi:uncharacterized repeat protein (TIGR01451 family)
MYRCLQRQDSVLWICISELKFCYYHKAVRLTFSLTRPNSVQVHVMWKRNGGCYQGSRLAASIGVALGLSRLALSGVLLLWVGATAAAQEMGLSVRTVKANVSVSNLSTTEQVLGDPKRQVSQFLAVVPLINFADIASRGRFGGDSPFPGQTFSNVDDFVVEVTGAVEIPEAGLWTFGVNSDDGFRLQVGDFTAACDCLRGASDTYATFNFQSAGWYSLRLIFFERGGGAALELFAAKGSYASWDATRMRLVGDVAAGGLRAAPFGDVPFLVVVQVPEAGVAGATLQVQPVIEVRELGGERLQGAVGEVVVTIASGTGGQLLLQGEQVASVTATLVGGVATFDGLGLVGRVGEIYTLRFEASNISPVQTDPLTVSGPGEAAQLVFVNQPQGGAAGDSLGEISVEVTDAWGNRVVNESFPLTLALDVNPGGGSLAGALEANTVEGLASFSGVSINRVGTGYTLVASAPMAALMPVPMMAPATSLPFNVAPKELSVTGLSGVSRVYDGGLIAEVEGQAVLLGVLPEDNVSLVGQPEFRFAQAAVGMAVPIEVSGFALAGSDADNYLLLPLVGLQANIFPKPLDEVSVEPIEPQAFTGSPIEPTVVLRDGNRELVAGVDYQSAFSDNALVGSASVTLSGLGNYMGTVVGSFEIMPGPPVALGIWVAPVLGASGALLSTMPVVEVLDVGGNRVTGSGLAVSVELLGLDGVLTGSLTVVTSAGVAAFSDVVVAGVVGREYRLRFVAEDLSGVDSGVLLLAGPGLASRLAIRTEPVGGGSGGVLGVQPVIEVLDAQGNLVISDGSTVVSVAIGSGAGGLLGGTLSVAAGGGVVSFSGVTLAGLVGVDYVLRFTGGPELVSVDSTLVQVTPGLLAAFEVLGEDGQPLAAQEAGSPFAVRVRALDAVGNVVSSFGGSVSLTSDAGLVGSPQMTASFVEGVLEREPLTLTRSGSATITATAVQLALSSASLPFTVLPAAADAGTSSLVVAPQASVVADGVASAVFTLTVRDRFGNLVAGAPAHFEVIEQRDDVLQGAPWVTAGDGVVVASLTSTVANVLTVSGSLGVGGLGPVVDVVAVTFVPGTASSLGVVTEPVGGISGGLLSVQPVVEVRDAWGNRVTTSSAVVTVSLVPDTSGMLGGSVSLAVVDGLAVFTDLTLSGEVATDYVLRFESSPLPMVLSMPTSITPGDAAAGSAILSATPLVSPLLADGRSTVLLTLVLRDAQGNRLDRGGDAVEFSTGLGSVAAVTDVGDGSYTAVLTAGEVPGSTQVGALVNGISITASAVVTFIEATAEILLEVTARRFGDPSTPFGSLPAVLPGDVVELRLTFLNGGTDAASNVVVVADLPAAFGLVAGGGGDWVEVVCPSLPSVEPSPEPVVSEGRLVMGSGGPRLRLPVDEVCFRSGFPPGERGWVAFRVEVR